MAVYVWTGRFRLDFPCSAPPACSFEWCLFLNMATDSQRANRYRHLWRTREHFRNVRRRQRAQASIVSLDATTGIMWQDQRFRQIGEGKARTNPERPCPSYLTRIFDFFFFSRFIRPALDVWLLNKMNSKRKVRGGKLLMNR